MSDYKLPAAIELGEIKLRVSELRRSVVFYTEVIGLHLNEQTEIRAALSVKGGQPLLVLEQLEHAQAMPRRSAAGLYHFALLVPNRRELGLVLKRLISCGIHVGHGDHGVSEALYISDPDNHGIEIYADRPRSSWKKDEDGLYEMGTDSVDLEGVLQAAGEAVWTGLPQGTVMGHVHLHVSDLEASRQFYCGVLGFEMMANTAHMGALFVAAGGYHHHLGLNIWAGRGVAPSPPHRPGLDYYTIIVPEETELERIAQRLQAAGVGVQRDGKLLRAVDPSGIHLRLAAK